MFFGGGGGVSVHEREYFLFLKSLRLKYQKKHKNCEV